MIPLLTRGLILSGLRGALHSRGQHSTPIHIEGQRWPLWNPQRGIFKPRGLPYLLSIRTVYPRKGARIWYDDQRRVHGQIFAGEKVLDYAFMASPPDNVWLREAAEHQVPIIYFLGVSPGRYQAIMPTYVLGWGAKGLRTRIAFGELAGAMATATAPDVAERRYALRLVKQAAPLGLVPGRVSSRPTSTGAPSATCPTTTCWTLPTSWLTPTSSSGSRCSPTPRPVQDPPRGFRQPPDRHRPRRPGPRLGAAARPPRRPPP